VDFFGIATRSRRVVFCLDISPSMAMVFNPETAPVPRFEMARRDLRRTLDGMAADVRFGIVTFHGRPVRWRPGLVPATEESRAAARAFVDGITFDEMGTNIFDAILECLDDLGSPGERLDADTIYVLSDGSSSVGPIIDTHEMVAELAVRLKGRRVVVHAIGISTDQNGEMLSNLARVTGGRYVDFRE
jgi:Mg-chelatase subunit ChlD